jgi:Glycosyl hydrolase family 85
MLNNENELFFDSCDGIFLNYLWNPEMLQASAQQAGEARKLDVFVGIDVFGRGTFGGGQLNTSVALDEIKKVGLSAALFAPGWTWEANPTSRLDTVLFDEVEQRLWLGRVKRELLPAKFEAITNGGDGWKLEENGGLGGGIGAMVTSHKLCLRRTEIDLIAIGITKEELACMPSIFVREFFAGTGPNFADKFQLSV